MSVRRPVMERFVEKVRVVPCGGCWEWTAYKDKGYGRIMVDGKVWGAHRWAYLTMIGPIPEGLHLDHLCRNRGCVNPWRLEPVTIAENILRGEGAGAKHARATACPAGHEYAGNNLSTRKGGWRGCKACKRIQSAAHKRRKKMARAES